MEGIAKRLLAGEKAADLAREFNVSRAFISTRFKNKVETVRTVANQLVSAEMALRDLPVSEQLLTLSLADDLRAISTHMAGGAKFSAATFHRLAGMANIKVQEVDDAAPLSDVSRKTLQDVAVLQKLANEAAIVPNNLLAANKDTVARINEMPSGDDQDYSAFTDDELRSARELAAKAQRVPKA